jgi:hypothetical protein
MTQGIKKPAVGIQHAGSPLGDNSKKIKKINSAHPPQRQPVPCKSLPIRLEKVSGAAQQTDIIMSTMPFDIFAATEKRKRR